MFDEKISAAIYLERNKIIFAYPEEKIFEQLPLDTSLINHLEIKNEEKFVQIVKTFFEQFPKTNAAIFLAKHIVFEREISDEEQEDNDQIDRFLEMVPIAKAKLGMKILKGEHSVLCLAANKEYFQLLIRGAEYASIKVTAVVPAFLFDGLESAQGLEAEKISSALSNSRLVKETNFLDQVDGETPEIDEEKSSDNPEQKNDFENDDNRSRKKRIILTIILIALLSFSVIFSYMNGLFDRFIVRNTVVSVPSGEEVTDLTIATQSASPLVSPVAISDLRALIRNGTGVPGQASKAKELLDELQLKEVVLATGSAQNSATTLLQYDPSLPPDLVQDVKTKLEELFESVDVNEATNTGEFEFLITTGEEKKD